MNLLISKNVIISISLVATLSTDVTLKALIAIFKDNNSNGVTDDQHFFLLCA